MGSEGVPSNTQNTGSIRIACVWARSRSRISRVIELLRVMPRGFDACFTLCIHHSPLLGDGRLFPGGRGGRVDAGLHGDNNGLLADPLSDTPEHHAIDATRNQHTSYLEHLHAALDVRHRNDLGDLDVARRS